MEEIHGANGMQSRMALTVYNKQAVQRWEDEFKEIPEKIKQQEAISLEAHQQLLQLRAEVNPLNDQISRLDSTISNLNLLSKIGFLEMVDHNRQIDITHASIDIANQFVVSNTLSDLRKFRTELAEKRQPLLEQIQEQEAREKKALKQCQQLKQRQEWCNLNIPSAIHFLRNLEENPKSLFQSFANLIEEKLTDFEENHFSQPTTIRLALFRFKDKIAQLKNYFLIVETYEKEWQIKYAILCSLVWDMLYKIENFKNEHLSKSDEQHYIDLFSLLRSLLEETHLSENVDLPDHLNAGADCFIDLVYIKSLYPDIFCDFENELTSLEKDLFIDASSRLYMAASKGNNSLAIEMQKLVSSVNDTIHNQENHQKKHPNNQPEYKLYTQLSIRGQAFLANPHDEPTQQSFFKMADHIHAKPNRNKKVLGALVGILAVTIVIGSIVTAIGTFGGATPLSIFALTFSSSLLAKALTIASVGAVGLTASVIGIGLFCSGMRKGPSKIIKRCEKAFNQTHSEQILQPIYSKI